MDTISALQPEKPPLGAWYLVTAGGMSSVKITDGLTFTEEKTHEGRQLALMPRCAEVTEDESKEEGLIRFRVDASGIWLTVCHAQWRLSGSEGVVVRPFPVFRPVDLYFDNSVVHLRPDITSVECDRAIELSLEPVPEGAQPLLSRTSIRQLQTRLNESQQGNAAAVRENPSTDPLAVISPLPEPGFRKITGQGRPSSIRLFPDPATRGEIPLLTDTVAPGDRIKGLVSVDSDLRVGEPAPLQDVPVTKFDEVVPDLALAAAEVEARELDEKAIAATPELREPERVHTEDVDEAKPKRRTFARLVAFAIAVFMVSTDLPRIPTAGGTGEERSSLPLHAVDLAPATPTEATTTEATTTEATTSEVLQIEPTGQPETSRQLMDAVQALLDSKSPTDPVTRQFVEDAIRVVNEAESTPDEHNQPTTTGSAGMVSEPSSETPESANSRI